MNKIKLLYFLIYTPNNSLVNRINKNKYKWKQWITLNQEFKGNKPLSGKLILDEKIPELNKLNINFPIL